MRQLSRHTLIEQLLPIAGDAGDAILAIYAGGAVSLVQIGSSLKFCRLVEAAGGAVLDLHGQLLRYGKPNVFNPSFIATRDMAIIPA